jgi:transcriptional regulator with XRE-family HTH domain
MPAFPPDAPPERDERLSSLLKAIRRRRGLTVQQMADRMGMKKRSYERFEAGEGLLKEDRIFRYAQATDSDPFAFVAEVRYHDPGFALACIDNKLAMLMVAHARDLFRTHGPDLRDLHPQMIVEAMNAAMAALRADLDQARGAASRWLSDKPAGDDSGDPE